MRALLAFAVVAALASTAVAQPSLAPSTPAPPAPGEVQEVYSPSTALALSLGTTLAGYGAFLVADQAHSDSAAVFGLVAVSFGPSVGHWYTGEVLTPGLGLRAGGVVALGAGLAVALNDCPIFGDHCNDSPGGAALAVAGAALWVSGTVYDIATASRAAHRANREAAQISIAPTITREQTGVAVVGTF